VGPARVHAVHIDHGFMRKEESETVEKALAKVDIKLHMVRCAAEFAAGRTKTPKGKEIGPLKVGVLLLLLRLALVRWVAEVGPRKVDGFVVADYRHILRS